MTYFEMMIILLPLIIILLLIVGTSNLILFLIEGKEKTFKQAATCKKVINKKHYLNYITFRRDM